MRPVTAISLVVRSVVRMAWAASREPLGLSLDAAMRIPSLTLSIGKAFPITPVEATKTSCGLIPRAQAASAAMIRASLSPVSPVQALAFPLFATIAPVDPDFTCSIVTRTGAALTKLDVKTPAAWACLSDTISARSGRDFFIPQCTPDALKPRGSVTPPGADCQFPCDSCPNSNILPVASLPRPFLSALFCLCSLLRRSLLPLLFSTSALFRLCYASASHLLFRVASILLSFSPRRHDFAQSYLRPDWS